MGGACAYEHDLFIHDNKILEKCNIINDLKLDMNYRVVGIMIYYVSWNMIIEYVLILDDFEWSLIFVLFWNCGRTENFSVLSNIFTV